MSTASPTVARTVHCPSWCTTTHPRDERPAENLHVGPKFGLIRGELLASDDLGIQGFVEEACLTPAGLRHLAADAIAAAQWIEQESGVAPAGPTFVGRGELFPFESVVPMLGTIEAELRAAAESGELETSSIDGRLYVSGEAVGEWLARRTVGPMSAVAAVLGCRIVRRMDELGLSVNALADRVAIPRSTLTRRLADPQSFYLPEVDRLADGLNVSPSWLLGAAGRLDGSGEAVGEWLARRGA